MVGSDGMDNEVNASPPPMSIHERCQYPNKQCPKRRTVKRNGQLHRFCEQHREKATINQKRWLINRVEEAQAKRGSTPSVPAPAAPPTGAVPVPTISNASQRADGSSLDEIDKLLFDEGEMNEFLDDLLLSQDELRALQEDVARACRFDGDDRA